MKNKDLDSFLEYELFPALYSSLNIVFPEMHFRKLTGKWESCYHLDGHRDGSGKASTYVYENSKFCIIDQATEEELRLIKFYGRIKGESDFWTIIEKLSKELNLTPPSTDTEKYKERKRKLDNREKAQELFVSSLWSDSPEAREVLDYLHSRTWTDEEIKATGIGLVTTAILQKVPDHTEFASKATDKEGRVEGSIGTTHTLTIPYRNGSRIFGFKVREPRKELKTSLKYLNTVGLTKSKGLFGIGVGIKDVVIVEGELDALHAQARGFRDIAATTGGAVTEEQLEDAVLRGAKRITLLFDNDRAGEKYILNKGKDGSESGTLPIAEAYGVDSYVGFLPDGVKDVDEFFQTGHSVKELEEIVKEAVPSFMFRYNLLESEYLELCDEQGGKLFLKQRADFVSAAAAIINAPYMKPQDRELVYKRIEATKDSLRIGMEEYRRVLDEEYFKEEAKKRAERTKAVADTIKKLTEEGKTDEAIALMKATAQEEERTDKATAFAKTLSPLTLEGYNSLFSELKDGLPTGFKFQEGGKTEILTLNEGLTFVVSNRGHGKTTFLNNIAINEARRQIYLQNEKGTEAKHVLYFSYEITKKRLLPDLLNAYVNDPDISGSRQIDTILNYLRAKATGGEEPERAKYFSGRTEGGHFKNFVRKEEEFFRDYIFSGVLTIVDEPYKVEELLEALKFYVKKDNVSLVIIDYAQLLFSEKYNRQRTEEIKLIVNDIKNFANKSGIPFLLAAQFNREVDTPLDVATKNIGEGGDLERIADTCIGLFNLKELQEPQGKDKHKEAEELLNLLKRVLDFSVSTWNDLKEKRIKDILSERIFFKLMKRRYGIAPLSSVLKWDGRTKYIEQNDSEHFLEGYSEEERLLSPQEEEEETLPF